MNDSGDARIGEKEYHEGPPPAMADPRRGPELDSPRPPTPLQDGQRSGHAIPTGHQAGSDRDSENDDSDDDSHSQQDGELTDQERLDRGVLGAGEDGDQDLETLSRVSSGPAYTAFSDSMRWWIVAMNCVSAFISPITANIYFPAIPQIANDLGVSVSMINLTVTTYMIMQGLAPSIFGDFGDAAGRRPAFIIAFTIYLGANIGLALQRSYPALLVLRMLQSGGSSGTIALVYAVVADIAPSHERGKFMGIVGAGLTVGPAIGPVIGGLISEYLGWPAIFWFLIIVTVVWLIPYTLTVPETSRKVVGNGSIPPQGWNMTLPDYVRFRRQASRDRSAMPKRKIPFPNPLHTLAILLQKDMAMLLVYNGLVYIGFMLITSTLSTQFAEIYGYGDLVLGLCYLPIGAATMVASISNGFVMDWNFRRWAKKLGLKIDRKRGNDLKDFPIERVRLEVTAPYLAVGTLIYIGYGWALHYEVHVAVPLVLSFFVGLFITGSFQIINVTIVDLFPSAPATATAANNLVRCSFGAVGVAVIEDMIQAMGRGWAFTLIAFIFSVPSPILWVIVKNGPRWREERRLKMLADAERKEAKAAQKERDNAQGQSQTNEENPEAGEKAMPPGSQSREDGAVAMASAADGQGVVAAELTAAEEKK